MLLPPVLLELRVSAKSPTELPARASNTRRTAAPRELCRTTDRLAVELLEQLASDTSTAELPIIALSKHSDLDQVERVWKNGVSDYLATPNTPVILERKVARFLSEVPLSSDSDEVPTTDDEEIETAPTDDNLEPVEVGV